MVHIWASITFLKVALEENTFSSETGIAEETMHGHTHDKDLECSEMTRVVSEDMRYTRTRMLQDSEMTQARLHAKLDTIVNVLSNSSDRNQHTQPQLRNHRDDSEPKLGLGSSILQLYYDLTVEGLGIIGEIVKSKDFFILHDRLQVWGLGLFEGDLELEEITENVSSGLGFRVFYITFIRVLLYIELILVTLEIESLEVLAFQERFANLFDHESITQEVLYYTALRMGLLKDSSEDKLVTCVLRLQDEFDKLDSLTPAIRTMRILHSRSISKQFHGKGASLQDINFVDSLGLVNSNINIARRIIASLREKEIENLQNEVKSTSGSLAALFEDEIEKLEKWKGSSQERVTTKMASVLAKMGSALEFVAREEGVNDQPPTQLDVSSQSECKEKATYVRSEASVENAVKEF